MATARLRIGIDVGGTFTDLFLYDEATGAVARHKLSSTPGEPEVAPLAGIREILAHVGASGAEVVFVGLGTTVLTNALLERKGAPTALVTTAGFRDLVEIARQKRPHTFDPFVSKPEPLVPRRLRLEVNERVAADGTVLVPLDRASVERALAAIDAAGVQAVAVCLLNAYANPTHEREIAALIARARPGLDVSLSADVLPEFREYERLSSTVVNAFLMPAARAYFDRFEAEVRRLGVPVPPFVMNSGGGIMTPAQAGRRPIDTLFSGPSGGVSGAVHVAMASGHPNIITFDMGGTSTDVCLVQGGRAQSSHTRVVNGFPLKAPALDVHTVGAGGSSIATLDAGGMLRVGPQSAGARPGPACYGRGGELATVTDANVALGRLNPTHLLGGALAIDASRAHAVIERHVASPRGMGVVEAAAAIVALADTNMAHAVRFVSVERGLDPADFMLTAFGGAGPVHAASVARQLGVAGVLVPPAPGVLCAMGVLVNDLTTDVSRTHIVSESAPGVAAALDATWRALDAQALAALERETTAGATASVARTADVRYAGQNHELTVDVPGGRIDDAAIATVRGRFHAAHRELYGYASEDKHIEFVTCRVRARVPTGARALGGSASAPRTGGPVPEGRRAVYFEEAGGFVECPVYQRDALRPDDRLDGPAIIEQMDCTTVVPPDFRLAVDAHANLLLTLREAP